MQIVAEMTLQQKWEYMDKKKCKMLPNLSFKKKNVYEGIFLVNNYLQGESCIDTYDLKKKTKILHL